MDDKLTQNSSYQRLLWDGSYNIRDLGGYLTASGMRIQPKRLIRADHPLRLTATGREALLAYGIRNIIDLRSNAEVAGSPHEFVRHSQIQYLHVPLGELADPTLAEQIKQARLYDWQFLVLAHAQHQIAVIFRSMIQVGPGGILVHCHAGKDRTGMIAALTLALLGVDTELIVNDYALSAGNLQAMYAPWIAEVAHDPQQLAGLLHDISSEPATMRDMLTYLTTHYGGAQAYLQHCGMSRQELDMLEAQLCMVRFTPTPVGTMERPA